jgi:hypothetical protein
MAKASKLKVFRTAAGFYDAFVAAPSQKAAIEAWGADKHVFARGGAEVVTDPVLTAEPLANPGKVIKRIRGTADEQIAALGKIKRPGLKRRNDDDSDKTRAPTSKRSATAKPAPRKKAPKPKPPPDREPVDKAEAALRAFEKRAQAELAEIRQREAQLEKERAALVRAQQREQARLEQALDAERERYRAAFGKWQESA